MDIDSRRIVSGGRFGEIKVWSLSDCLNSEDDSVLKESCNIDTLIYAKGRSLYLHDRTTAVGQIKIKNILYYINSIKIHLQYIFELKLMRIYDTVVIS